MLQKLKHWPQTAEDSWTWVSMPVSPALSWSGWSQDGPCGELPYHDLLQQQCTVYSSYEQTMQLHLSLTTGEQSYSYADCSALRLYWVQPQGQHLSTQLKSPTKGKSYVPKMAITDVRTRWLHFVICDWWALTISLHRDWLDSDCVDPPWEAAILRGKGHPTVKYRDTLRPSVQKRLNRSRCCLGSGLRWAVGIMC